MPKIHQVFVGCPFRTQIRKNYDHLKRDLELETPLHVVLADTAAISSTDYLLEHITNLIRDSATCLFDVTGGNANVSLEVGIAHAMPAEFLLALYTRRERVSRTTTSAAVRTTTTGEVRPIISDLQGRNRVEYKTYGTLKSQFLDRHLKNIPYMKRWTEFQRKYASFVPFALRVVEEIRTSGRTTRNRVDAIVSGSGIGATELSEALTTTKVLSVRRGRDGGYFYPSK